MRHIDGHCHFFNIRYAFREAIEVLWHSFVGIYPYDGRKRHTTTLPPFIEQDFSELLKHVASLVGASTRSARRQYNYEQKKYQKSSLGEDGEELVTVPLMMDIYYIYDKDYADIEIESELVEGDQIPPEQQKQFLLIADTAKKDVLTEISHLGYDDIAEKEDIDSALQDIIEEFLEEPFEESIKERGKHKYRLSRGYRKHMEELERLAKRHPETVIPFLAVDPRRYGFMDLVRAKVGKDKPFKGIKLYPALGYLPSHPQLIELYEFCIKHDVPITLHALKVGLPSFAKSIYVQDKYGNNHWYYKSEDNLFEPCEYFGAPKNWQKVLENYDKLRLNFGHFGGCDSFIGAVLAKEEIKDNWAKQIIDLMEDFENVYADFSYCTSEHAVNRVGRLVMTYPIVAKRAFFGTDYIMIMTEPSLEGGLEEYFNHFRGLPREMVWDNARAFLGL